MERMQRPGHSEIQLSKVTISGRVLDESGFPLAGATIQEKETANGAIADSEGKFTLVVADNAALIERWNLGEARPYFIFCSQLAQCLLPECAAGRLVH